MANLVDLSLFAVSPTNDSHFTLVEESVITPPPSYQSTTMRNFSHISSRRHDEMSLEPRSLASKPSRFRLNYMKKIRTEPALPAPDKLVERRRPEQTLQQRRHREALTPTLTIPTTPSSGSHPSIQRAAPSTATTSHRTAAPMIWLPDEEMWLIADAAPAEHAELYGYYAPPPHSDPGPRGHAYEEAPPSYASTIANNKPPSPTELSPVRSQFLSLMHAGRSAQIWPREHSSQSSTHGVEDVDMSPFFQEAISGVGFGVSYEGSGTGWSRNSGRRESFSTDFSSAVSPLSPESAHSRWRIRRSSSARV